MFTITTIKTIIATLPAFALFYWVGSGIFRHRKNISGFIWETKDRLDALFNRSLKQWIVAICMLATMLILFVALKEYALFFIYILYLLMFIVVVITTYSVTDHETKGLDQKPKK